MNLAKFYGVLEQNGLRCLFEHRNYFHFQDLLKLMYPSSSKHDCQLMEVRSIAAPLPPATIQRCS